MSEEHGLVYVGKIVLLESIPDADYVISATVVCGVGGKWRGVVRKDQYAVGDICIVYLPDSVVPESEEMHFLASSNWRVKMRRFRGAPSEVVIMPWKPITKLYTILEMEQPVVINDLVGFNCTIHFGVIKYHKPVPANLQGIAKGPFPGFIPKTDEPNYQNMVGQEFVEKLHGNSYYITEKADGSSTTAFRYKGEFGICSRNLELERDEENGYWKVAAKYEVEKRLPEGYALQWETCGPKIQSNPMGLSEVDGFAFSAYKIDEHRYLDMHEFLSLCKMIGFPTVPLIDVGFAFDKEKVHTLGEGTYANGKEREGVVVRSKENVGHAPISFKVINLNYEK